MRPYPLRQSIAPILRLFLVVLATAFVSMGTPPSTARALTIRGDYLWVQGPDCPAGWSDLNFDDSHWKEAIYPNVLMWQREWTFDSEARPLWGDASNSCVRRHFKLTEKPKEASAVVWVDDDYELYINGTFVGKSADGWAEMPGQKYDVAPLLKDGDNVIAMLLQDRVGEHYGALFALTIPGVPEEPRTWLSLVGPLRQSTKFVSIVLAAVLLVIVVRLLSRRLAPLLARYPALLLALTTVVVAAAAQWCFLRQPLYTYIVGQPLTDWNWAAIALALGMVAVLAILLAAQPASESIGAPPRREGWILLAILLLAAYLRAVDIDNVPPGFFQDEAINGLDSLRLYKIPEYELWSDSIGGRPTLFLYAVGAALKYFGISYVTLKIVPIIVGVASVAALYLVGRVAVGPRAALCAAFLLAASRWHVHFSRMAWEVNCVPLFSALGFALLLRGFERNRHAVISITAGAVLLATGLYTYAAYRAIAGIAVLFVLATALSSDRSVLLKKFLGLFAAAVAAVAVITPLVQFAIKNPNMYWARYSDISLTTYMNYHSTPMPWLHQVGKALLSLNHRGDLDTFPFLDPITGMLLLVGVAAMAPTQYRRGFRLAWCWLVGFAVLSSLTKDSPHATRMLGMLPPAMLLAGFGAVRLFDLVRGVLAVSLTRAAAAAVAAVIIAVNAYWYFAHMQQLPEVDLTMNQGARRLCTYLAETEGGTVFWTDDVAYNCRPQCAFLLAGTGAQQPEIITEREVLDTTRLKKATPPVTVIINITTLERAGEKLPRDANGDPILDLPTSPWFLLSREGKVAYFVYRF